MAEELQRCLVWIAACAGGKVVPQRGGRLRQSTGHTAWPMVEVRAHKSNSVSGCECFETTAFARRSHSGSTPQMVTCVTTLPRFAEQNYQMMSKYFCPFDRQAKL